MSNDYVKIAPPKGAEPPPFNFEQPAIYVPPNNPLTPEQTVRARSLAAALETLGDRSVEEIIDAATYIATGAKPSDCGDDDA